MRVALCLTRDLWPRFPMLGVLEDLVTRLNGWPSLRPQGEPEDSDAQDERQARVQRTRHRLA